MLTCFYLSLLILGGGYIAITFIVGELVDFGEGVAHAIEGLGGGIAEALGSLYPACIQAVDQGDQLLCVVDALSGGRELVALAGKDASVTAQQVQGDLLDRPTGALCGLGPISGRKLGQEHEQVLQQLREQLGDNDGLWFCHPPAYPHGAGLRDPGLSLAHLLSEAVVGKGA